MATGQALLFLKIPPTAWHKPLYYIGDFSCPEKAVVIEVEGDVHGVADHVVRDQEREKDLRSLGLRIIRYTNDDSVNNVGTM